MKKPDTDSIQDKANEKKKEGFAFMAEKFGHEAKEFGGKIGHEAKEFEEKISHLPVNKKWIFFTGIVLVILALLVFMGYGSLSATLLLLLGIGIAYMGVSNNNFFIQDPSSKKKKK